MTFWAWAIVAVGVLTTGFLAWACRVQASRADDEIERLIAEREADDELAHQVRVGEGWGLV